MRCAVYTRKSTDEGLDQAFNSLDAQREACEAYVASQRHEGWSLLPDRYDDGGFSGGTIARPALTRLMAEVAAGRVDVIVIYKIDRLTRALSDFARIVEVLDRAGASFVSVTQQFNTTTSMGRLTLNVLLSFAQFEREVGAERVRDKVAASKRKGLWMGGLCPLGYHVRDRRLVVNEPEAATVRQIFTRYLKFGSVLVLEAELDRLGVRSKVRTGRDGATRGSQRFTRGALYTLLKNRIYVGEVSHKGAAYPGQHDGIVERGTFDSAQALLASNRAEHQHGSRANEPSLLSGLLWDAAGRRMSPDHATKGSLRYRYYVSRSEGNAEAARAASRAIVRVPAAALEDVVLARLAGFLRDAHAVHAAVEQVQADAVTTDAVLFTARELARKLADVDTRQRRPLLDALVERIEVHPDRVQLDLRTVGLFELAELSPITPCSTVALSVPVQLIRRSREVRLIVAAAPSGAATPERDGGLIKLLVKAHAARAALMEGNGRSLREVAQDEGHEPHYFSVLVKLGYLAPDITAAILEGRQPFELTRQTLARIRNLPISWDEQRRLLAFEQGE